MSAVKGKKQSCCLNSHLVVIQGIGYDTGEMLENCTEESKILDTEVKLKAKVKFQAIALLFLKLLPPPF